MKGIDLTQLLIVYDNHYLYIGEWGNCEGERGM